MNRNLYVDVHILQDVPPSNINRDDSGTPKQATYGGVTRLRVSSQAWKRAARLYFGELMDAGELGIRTRRFTTVLADELMESGVDEPTAKKAAVAAASALGIKPGKKESDLAYLLFFGRPQLREIAARVVDNLADLTSLDGKALEEKAASLGIKEALGKGHSLDVALFGRMVADLSDLEVDAAAQVAHAISTHGAATEFDYFTAVDDQQTDETGAGMIGMVEFNSATLYRYATVGVHQLLENLDDAGATVAGVEAFLRAFALSMPSGHKNSFAPRTRPGLVLIVVREDQPVNLVSAFEKPVFGGPTGTLAPSMRRLAGFAAEESVRWDDKPLLSIASYTTPDSDDFAVAFGASRPMEAVLGEVADCVAAWLER